MTASDKTIDSYDKRGALMIAVFYAIGTVGHVLHCLRGVMSALTPFVLLAGGLLVMLYTIRTSSRMFIAWCFGTYLITFVLEAIGTETGVIFGSYTYGPTLGLKILNVPLVIGLNWVIVVLGAVVCAQRITRSIFGIVVITVVLTVAFDIPLELVAIRLDYWQWSGGLIPLRNYIAWGVVSAVVSLVFCLARLRVRTLMPFYYYLIQFFFFIAIDLLILVRIL